jgi:hypothetical protein
MHPDHGAWQGGVLRLRVPEGAHIEVRPRAAHHVLFGPCDVVGLQGGQPLARFQAVDWDRPTFIPPLDRPGALPAGAGTAILNFLARQAPSPLRYRGPYPTGALFDALLECFRVADPVAAFHRFTQGVEHSALAGRMHEVPVDFEPAPFVRRWHEGRGVCVQLRQDVEKVYIHGRGYARDAAGPRRVRRDRDHWIAVVEILGREWARTARFDDSGALIDGPHPLPRVHSALIGRTLPGPIRDALAAALPDRAPALMKAVLHQLLGATPLVIADTGDELAIGREGRIEVHALLLEWGLASHPVELLEALALAVEPVAQRLAQAALEPYIDL